MKSERKSLNLRSLLAILCAIILVPGDTLAQTPKQSPAPASSPRRLSLSGMTQRDCSFVPSCSMRGITRNSCSPTETPELARTLVGFLQLVRRASFNSQSSCSGRPASRTPLYCSAQCATECPNRITKGSIYQKGSSDDPLWRESPALRLAVRPVLKRI